MVYLVSLMSASLSRYLRLEEIIGGVFREGWMKGGVVVSLVPFTWTLTCCVEFNFS